ncbi:hypothetical protein AYL99_03339 [Fonsecaea erecta]|uniref:Uncharacterized protein n=1 Tax=Fonsecaea erecta TaxID=1367422 RepID=A0A178ZMU7_9EURO|nr:hypothetical protein AYL99_03339 [Fonsecaea erecta]OAP61138.1 hypothetical protein AYL99_03339 [Fonsecaea erecta]
MATDAQGLKECDDCGKLIAGFVLRCAMCTVMHDLRLGDSSDRGEPQSPVWLSDDDADDDEDDRRTMMSISDDEDDIPDVSKTNDGKDRVQPHASTPPVHRDGIVRSLKRRRTEASLFIPRKRFQPRQISVMDEAARSLRRASGKNEVQYTALEPQVGRTVSGEAPRTVVEKPSVQNSSGGIRAGSSLQQSNGASTSLMGPPTTTHPGEVSHQAVVPPIVSVESAESLSHNDLESPVLTELAFRSQTIPQPHFTPDQHDLYVEGKSSERKLRNSGSTHELINEDEVPVSASAHRGETLVEARHAASEEEGIDQEVASIHSLPSAWKRLPKTVSEHPRQAYSKNTQTAFTTNIHQDRGLEWESENDSDGCGNDENYVQSPQKLPVREQPHRNARTTRNYRLHRDTRFRQRKSLQESRNLFDLLPPTAPDCNRVG